MNTCAGQKTAAYRKTMQEHGIQEEKSRFAGCNFHAQHKDEIEALICKFREENRARYPEMRDSNIALLTEIAVEGTRNSDRIAAIKELDSIMGYNQQNLNLNGKVDSEIEVTITNLF